MVAFGILSQNLPTQKPSPALSRPVQELFALRDEVIALKREGRHRDALPKAEESVRRHVSLLSENSRYTAESYCRLGQVQEELGTFREAEASFREAVEIWKKMLGPDHEDTAAGMSNLAGALSSQHRFEEALSLYQRALAATEKATSPRSSATATILDNLGRLLRDMGRYREAEGYYRRALAFREELPENGADIAQSLENLTMVFPGRRAKSNGQSPTSATFRRADTNGPPASQRLGAGWSAKRP